MIADYNWDRIAKTVEVIHSNQNNKPYIQIDSQSINAGIIFDSRNPQFHQAKNFETHLWQSFVGWKIKTEESVFNPTDFKMMDFGTPQDNYTQFVYVLPYSDQEALIEITRFGKEIIPPDLADLRLAEYLEKLHISYAITDTEIGCIPMSNVETGIKDIPGVINLGSRANAIKPSTGYAFKSMHAHAQKIAHSIQKQPTTVPQSIRGNSHFIPQQYPNNIPPTTSPSRFKFYDSLLLKILEKQPHWGKPIFEQLFNRVKIPRVMQFLDEKTTAFQDISILGKLPFKPFLSVFIQHPSVTALFRPLGLLLIALLLLILEKSTLGIATGNLLLIVGLISVGIPHGAVDHLLETKQWDKKTAPAFIFKYLMVGGIFALTWMALPTACLIFFLLYSAWHFGQADGENWEMSKTLSFLWGATVLLFILCSHGNESAEIIAGITGTHWGNWSALLKALNDTPVKSHSIASGFGLVFLPWLYYSFKRQNWELSITMVWLIASAFLPLMWSFGLYFIGQHSINGWYKIKHHLQISHKQLWVQSLPFHLGAWALLLIFYGLFNQSAVHSSYTQITFVQVALYLNPNLSSWAPFFIFLACISLPHTVAMDKLYRK